MYALGGVSVVFPKFIGHLAHTSVLIKDSEEEEPLFLYYN